jgi:hypothetical protein
MYQKRILPFFLFPLLSHPKLLPLWSVPDRQKDGQHSDTCYLSTNLCLSSFFSSIANFYLVPTNFSFLLLSCLNYILNYFFLSYFGLFELAFFLLWVILNWLFLVLRQLVSLAVFGAASLAHYYPILRW